MTSCETFVHLLSLQSKKSVCTSLSMRLQALELILRRLSSPRDLAAVALTCRTLNKCVRNSRLHVTTSDHLTAAWKGHCDNGERACDAASVPVEFFQQYLSWLLHAFPRALFLCCALVFGRDTRAYISRSLLIAELLQSSVWTLSWWHGLSEGCCHGPFDWRCHP